MAPRATKGDNSDMNEKLAIHSIPAVKDVRIESGFWGFYRNSVRDKVLPYQWQALNDEIPDAEPSHCVENFRMAARKNAGEAVDPTAFHGMVFQDSDLAKWLEAAAYLLATREDPALDSIVDEMIDLVGAAQEPDGYLDTYFTVAHPDQKWTNLTHHHELYCAGHMLEAAIALYECTGRTKLLAIMERNMACIASVLGPEPGKRRGYPGHPELELALMRLYRLTGKDQYLQMAAWFVDERGQTPLYFEGEEATRGAKRLWSSEVIRPPLAYFQADKPVREQAEIRGHAVRALYLLAGMADVAAHTGDASLHRAVRRWWESTVNRQMYVTGGVGSTHHGEAFSFPYHLPNDTVYAETCASIALIFVAQRLLRQSPDRAVSDVMERALYNTCIGSMQRDGTRFLYVNPLEVWPEASANDCDHWHVTPQRQKWFGCACCPPNLARLIASLGQYAYSMSGQTAWVHLYVEGQAELETPEGLKMRLEVNTAYPYDGTVTIRKSGAAGTLALRIPAWCRQWQVAVDGNALPASQTALPGNGYVPVALAAGTQTVTLTLEMPVERVYCSTAVPENIGKVAVSRGPLIYCIEGADNGTSLWQCALPKEAALKATFDETLLDGMTVITAEGVRLTGEGDAGNMTASDMSSDETGSGGTAANGIGHPCLYEPGFVIRPVPATLTFIPYHAWSNRETGEMRVWLTEV